MKAWVSESRVAFNGVPVSVRLAVPQGPGLGVGPGPAIVRNYARNT